MSDSFSPSFLIGKKLLIYRQRRTYRAFGVTMKRGWKVKWLG